MVLVPEAIVVGYYVQQTVSYMRQSGKPSTGINKVNRNYCHVLIYIIIAFNYPSLAARAEPV